MKIGVLAIQRDFAQYAQVLEAIGVESVEVRLPRRLAGRNGLVLPGGESTTMRRLVERWDLRRPILDFRSDRGLHSSACAPG